MRWRLGFFAIFLFCVASIAYALYHQFYHWIMPCLQCVYERMAIVAVGVFALLAAVWRPRSRAGIIVACDLVLTSALVGAGVAVRHLMLQYGPPDPAASCDATLPFPINLNDPFWPRWLGALIRPVGDCSQVDFVLLGLSMPAWVLVACLGIGLVTVWLGIGHWREVSARRFWK